MLMVSQELIHQVSLRCLDDSDVMHNIVGRQFRIPKMGQDEIYLVEKHAKSASFQNYVTPKCSLVQIHNG